MSIAADRAGLVAILEAALEGHDANVVDHVPEELLPPTVVVDAGEDYLTRGETYAGDEWWLTLRVFLLVDLAGNAQATEDLEQLLTRVLPALAGSEWEVDPIGRPDAFHTSQWLAHGVAVTVRTLTTLNNPGDNP